MSGNNPNHYYGKATIKADGKTYDFDDAVFEPSGVTREPIRNGRNNFVQHTLYEVIRNPLKDACAALGLAENA